MKSNPTSALLTPSWQRKACCEELQFLPRGPAWMKSSHTVSSESCTSRLPTYTVASWFLSCACWPMRLAPTPAVMRPPATEAMTGARCYTKAISLEGVPKVCVKHFQREHRLLAPSISLTTHLWCYLGAHSVHDQLYQAGLAHTRELAGQLQTCMHIRLHICHGGIGVLPTCTVMRSALWVHIESRRLLRDSVELGSIV